MTDDKIEITPDTTVYKGNHSDAKLHIDPDCGWLKVEGGRPLSSYPPDQREWCGNCARELKRDADGRTVPVELDIYKTYTEKFREKHGLTEEDTNIQFEKLREEGVELKAALLFNDGDVGEELADLIFVAHLLAHMQGIDLREEFLKVAEENLEKNRERDDNGLITKD